MKLKRIFGQPSWRVVSNTVEAYVTQLGGHMAPVTFDRQHRKFCPYSVAPWAEEKYDASLPTILQALRGDFFCLPFGGNSTPFKGEQHPVHGETASLRWQLESLSAGCLHLSMRTKTRSGRVDKRICLKDGQNAIYSQHVITGMTGPMPLGHHATLKFPDEPNSGLISTSRFVRGQVAPGALEDPAQGGYSWLKPGAEFRSLAHVPTISGATADLSAYPARRGFEDLVMMLSDDRLPFAWTAVSFPKQRYVWFALKDPRVLRSSVFWISNGGRHYAPWNGRHTAVMGLEEVTSYFHFGLAESAKPNPVSRKGFPTCLQLRPQQPTVINYIMAVASVPANFSRVDAIEADKDLQAVTIRDLNGKSVRTAVDVGFLNHKGAATLGA